MSQGSLNDDSPVDAADEQLVAYLDGELPQEDVRSVELRLTNDPVYRRRLRDLQNGWEMLDELPLPSSSAMLLETTLRMAAVDGGQTSSAGKSKSILKSISKFAWTALLVLGCFGLGMFAVGVRNYLSYQRQLRDLPTAMHIDAYLHANDVAFMKLLQEMPEWQQATKIASQLGVWNFDLIEEVQSVKPKQRETLLHSLPMESQESIRAAWERFENMSADRKQVIEDSAEIVASQPDSDQLLQTMDQFAAWRQTLPIEQRDQLENGTAEQRKSVVRKALEDTTRQWTREQGRALTDDEIETIYASVRQLGRSRIEAAKKLLDPRAIAVLDSFGFEKQQFNTQFEATFLRRLFDPKYEGPGRREGEFGPPSFGPPPASPGAQGSPGALGSIGNVSSFVVLRNITESIRGPLRDDELYLLVADLPENLSVLIHDASGIPFLQEELLRSWAEESLRRMQWNRGGRTALDRYQARDSEERDTIDLLPADRLLRTLQSDARR